MEVEFNVSRVSQPGREPVTVRRSAATHDRGTEFVAKTALLRQKLDTMSEVRPEEVERAKSLLQDESYPPDLLVRGLAALLATQTKE